MATKKSLTKSQLYIYILVVLGLIAVINYLSSKVFKRLDLTENREYSISQATKNMLKSMDDIVNIKVYFSKNLPPNMLPLQSGVKDLLTEFKAYAGKNLLITEEDPGDDEEKKRKVRDLGIPELQLQTFEKDKAQSILCFMGIAVFYADKKEVLPFVQDLNNLEYDLAQAIMKVFRSKVPKVGILKTDSMPYIDKMTRMQNQQLPPDPTEQKYEPIYSSLQNNYEVVTVDVSEGKEVDPEIKTLIIPGGDDRSFTKRDLFEIDQFFMNGGNLIVLAEGVKIDFMYGRINAMPQSPQILNLLEHYGVRVEKSFVCDASCGRVSIPQRVGMFQMNVPVDYPYFVRLGQGSFNKDNPAVSGLGEAILPWVCPVTILIDSSGSNESDSGIAKAEALVFSSPKSWLVSGNYDLNPRQDWRTIISGKSDELNQYNLAVHLNGNFHSYFAGRSVPPVREAEDSSDALNQIQFQSEKDKDRTVVTDNKNRHLVVIGDADFVSSQQKPIQGNIALILNIVDWLSLDENLIAIRSRILTDRTIQNDQLKEGSSLPNIIRVINIMIMPVILIVIGLIIFFKRRESSDNTKPSKGK